MEDNKLWLVFCAVALVVLTATVMSVRYEMQNADKNETNDTQNVSNATKNVTFIHNEYINSTYMNVSVYPQINFTPVLNITVEKEHIVIQIHQDCVLPLTNVSQNTTTNYTVGNTTGTNSTFQNGTNSTNSSDSNGTEWICREEKRKNKKD